MSKTVTNAGQEFQIVFEPAGGGLIIVGVLSNQPHIQGFGHRSRNTGFRIQNRGDHNEGSFIVLIAGSAPTVPRFRAEL